MLVFSVRRTSLTIFLHYSIPAFFEGNTNCLSFLLKKYPASLILFVRSTITHVRYILSLFFPCIDFVTTLKSSLKYAHRPLWWKSTIGRCQNYETQNRILADMRSSWFLREPSMWHRCAKSSSCIKGKPMIIGAPWTSSRSRKSFGWMSHMFRRSCSLCHCLQKIAAKGVPIMTVRRSPWTSKLSSCITMPFSANKR